MRRLVDEGGRDVEKLQPVGMIERLEEPPQRVRVLEAVVRHREVGRAAGVEDHPRGGHLDGVEDLHRVLAGEQQRGELVDVRRFRLGDERLDQPLRLGGHQRCRVREQPGLAEARRGRLHRRLRLDAVFGEHGPAHLTRHLVRGVPARTDRHVEGARVDDVVRVVPADGLAKLDGCAGAMRLVPRRVRAVVEHPVLHVDQSREHELREQLSPPRLLLEETQEDAVGLQHLAALDQRQPVIQAFLERSVEHERLLIGPVTLGRQQRRIRISLLPAAAVVAGHPAEQLVPRVESGRHVPERLRDRQPRELVRQQAGQPQARARAQETVIVVDEAEEAVVDPLVIRDVGVGPVDADGLVEDLRRRPAGAYEIVEHRARADLVTRHDPLFQLPVESAGPVHGVTPFLTSTSVDSV